MTKIQDWATGTVHDGPTEHWRVTALLAKDAHQLWKSLCDMSGDQRSALPQEVQIGLRILYRRLELTDYFLSGLRESKES